VAVEPAANLENLPPPLALPQEPLAEPWERPLRLTLSWPQTRLARWSLSLLLTGALYLPAVAAAGPAWQWVALVLPSATVVLGCRAFFEKLVSLVRSEGRGAQIPAVGAAALGATGAAAAASSVVGVRWSAGLIALSSLLCLLILSSAVRMRDTELRSRWRQRCVYFIGSPELGRQFRRELRRCQDRQLVGCGSFEGAGELDAHRMASDIRASGAAAVILDRAAMRNRHMQDALSRLTPAGVWIAELETFYESEFKKLSPSELASESRIIDDVAASAAGLARRRLLDAAAAACLLLLTLPVLACAALMISLTSRGPVLYRQRRMGRGGAPFTLLKLRTMTVSAEDEPTWAPLQAHRVTPLGRCLRRFRIDELPQFWNVLCGDLSMIGPRPEQVPIAERLAQQLPHYHERHAVRPGITGWAQVNLESASSVEESVAKLQRDLYYVKRRSLRLDALIIWLTLKTVISGRGS
jgi:exopolysaccharide biosynthesis polyprenyl glycosylphosphotransferase